MTTFNEPHIRVLGTSGAWLNGCEPCSSYLVQDRSSTILLDCGTGAVAALNQFVNTDQALDAIIISHAHPDHCFDLVPLLYDHVFGLRQGQRPRLYLSTETHERLIQMAKAFSDKEDFWGQAYDIELFGAQATFQIGGFACAVQPLPHAITSWATRLDHQSGRSFVYSGDVGQAGIGDLTAHAQGAHVLICEAGIPAVLDPDHEARASHLDPRQAGLLAADADVEHLYLVHVPTNYNHALACQQASEQFSSGSVRLPSSGAIIR